VNVQDGTWTLGAGKTIAVDTDGVLKVGVTGAKATLVIANSGILKSAGDGDGSTGINVFANSILEGATLTFLDQSITGTTKVSSLGRAADLNKIWLETDANLNLNDVSGQTVTTENMASVKGVLTTGAGLINYVGAKIELSDSDKTPDGNIKDTAASLTGAILQGVTTETDATGGDATVAGGYGADAVVVNNSIQPEDSVKVSVADNLTLLGTNGDLITATDNSAGKSTAISDVIVGDDKTITLGSADPTVTSSDATLNSNVVLGDSTGNATLAVKAATYTIDGNITAKAANEGAVQADSGGTLTVTGDIGKGDAVGLVNADNGTIDVTGTINTQNISVSNGGKLSTTTLTAAKDVTVEDGALSLTGTGKSTVGGELFLSDAIASVGDLEVTGVATMENTAFDAEKVTFSDNATLSGGTHAVIDTLTGESGKTIAVGDSADTVSSSLSVTTLALGGGNLVVDPAWGAPYNHVEVLKTDVGSGDAYVMDGNVGVGQNSMLTFGLKDGGQWLADNVNAVTNGAGLTKNGVTAAMGIYTPLVLGDKSGTGYSLIVDGSKMNADLVAAFATPETVTFAGNSLLVVTAQAASSTNGALSATQATTATVEAGAKLRITDAKVGRDYRVLGENIDNGGGINYDGDKSGWRDGNLSTDSRMITLARVADTGTFRTTLNSTANWMPKLDSELVGVVDRVYALDDNNTNANERGVRFLSRATNVAFIGADSDLAAKTIESAARMAALSGAPQMTRLINNAAGAAVTQRTSIAIPQDSLSYGIQSMAADGTVERGVTNMNKTGAALWIMPLYQSQNVNGMEAGHFDMNWNGGFGGVALGADYTFESAVRAGINFNMGGGYLNGGGDLADTTNRFNFWGIGAYLGYNMNNFGLSADVNYTHTYNEVEQDLPGGMGMNNLKSDITAHAIAVGLRGEYKFETSVMDIVPHIGVRFMNLTTDAYDVKSGGTVLRGDAIHQNIWSFPIGVAFYKTVNTGNGWFFKPSLDLSVIPAAGDIKGKSKVRFTGTDRSAELDTRIMDYVTYQGGLGLEFGTQNVSFGLNYNLQVSEHTTGHGVFGTFRYEF
jgi:hypothetical protein